MRGNLVIWILIVVVGLALAGGGGFILGNSTGYNRGYEQGLAKGKGTTTQQTGGTDLPPGVPEGAEVIEDLTNAVPTEAEFGKFEISESDGVISVVGRVTAVNSTSITIDFKSGAETYVVNSNTIVLVADANDASKNPQVSDQGISIVQVGEITQTTYRESGGQQLAETIVVYR